MYPNLYYAVKDLFGIENPWPWLRFINSFGFFVAIAFLVAAALLGHELRRKSQLGFFKPTEMKVMVGKPASTTELLTNFLLGFVLGYKILALFFLDNQYTQDPQAYIFSGMGNWWLGLAVGALFAWLKWREKKKHQLEKPAERTVRLWPQDRVGEFTIIALVVGLAGAKLFDIFENWGRFMQDPVGTIFSGGGLTFYGGLICAALAIMWYARRHKISIPHLADCIAPALMIAYAIGRIGCQVAGDGDWGVFNSAYTSSPDGQVLQAQPGQFNASVQNHNTFYTNFVAEARLDSIPHTPFTKPSGLGFLPDWMFAFNYPNNVNNVGIPVAGCQGPYCSQLPTPAFPTPFYETVMCLLLFGILWLLRKRLRIPGTLFAIYLVLNGAERFTIEQIRVNNRMDFYFGLRPSQAEVIAVGLMAAGVIIYVFLRKKYQATPGSV
jgi:prolipoprotein diacylglyceryltransferase